MKSSREAIDLIIAAEVTSKEVYVKKYQRPEWPGGASGITVGIGSDLCYASPEKIRADWGSVVDPETLKVMVSCSGISGERAKNLLPKVRNKILITWDQAIDVFLNSDVPEWEARLEKTLPNTDLLSPNQFGVLVSLIYNRGASFSKAGPRYAEMRNIKTHMQNKNLKKIPGELRAMKRLWGASLSGLRKRRDDEARLFEKDL